MKTKILKPGPKKLSPYDKKTEQQMKETYNLLSEKDKRLYVAVETSKLKRGGIAYTVELFNCSRNTIFKGINELKRPELIDKNRTRHPGGGRKSAIDTIENIDGVFLKVIDNYIAGDPMNGNLRWTNLGKKQICERMKTEGIDISVTVVTKLLKKHGFSKRKALKKRAIGTSNYRNEQFENIERLKEEYLTAGNPVVSVDTKKKEFIGNLYREGSVYTTQPIEVYDHDFPYLADGVVVPYTVYDINKNIGFVNLGTSKDTSEFACDSIKAWWYQMGRLQYKKADSILVLADGGGSNSARHYIFKEDLQKLVNEIGVKIRIAHFPPYTSKWNPVEHRVFPHITRALQGVVLKSYEFVKELIESTTTKAGLKIIANITSKIYETGRKYSEGFKENMKIIFDDFLGQWNYCAIPQDT